MDLGFETIGNATLICHDAGPVLATDPWLDGSAYFGSWVLAHAIPDEQRAAVQECEYVWISHGHPDHLSPDSLRHLRDKEILLADHYGRRIHDELAADGYRVRILPDGEWTQLSDRIRVASFCDIMQDAALAVDIDGRLVLDANDAGDHGIAEHLRALAQGYDTSFLLMLTGYGDADMINFFDEAGKRIPPPAMDKKPVGPVINELLEALDIGHFVPFSSMHKYQRTDSAWANECITPLDVHHVGFDAERRVLLPPFVRYDLIAGEYRSNDPAENPDDLHEPEEFGDNWSDELTTGDRAKIAEYLGRVTHLRCFLGFVNFRVGGKDNVIDVNRERFDLGMTIEVPRQSLMTAVEYRVFDDILIGNFARVILHGDWGDGGSGALYPQFTPFLTKFGDNGGAYSAAELRAYFAEYRRRGFFVPRAGDEARALAPYLA